MSTALATLTNQLAAKLNMGDGGQLIETLKATAFKGQVSDAQMTALMVVANQYGLNPWTKEIYAFPDRNNGIVPVVGVDGWSRIINEHAQFDGLEFVQDEDSCTCVIYRKDRSHPVRVTEYMSECNRKTGPWQSHPKRMLRHKALIQAARLAFGYTGIFDQDEAERIVEASPIEGQFRKEPEKPEMPILTPELLEKQTPRILQALTAGTSTADGIIAKLQTKYVVDNSIQDVIRAMAVPEPTQTNDEWLANYENGAQQ